MKKTTLFALAAVCLLVSACNTVRGVGKDLQAAGQGIDNCVSGRRC